MLEMCSPRMTFLCATRAWYRRQTPEQILIHRHVEWIYNVVLILSNWTVLGTFHRSLHFCMSNSLCRMQNAMCFIKIGVQPKNVRERHDPYSLEQFFSVISWRSESEFYLPPVFNSTKNGFSRPRYTTLRAYQWNRDWCFRSCTSESVQNHQNRRLLLLSVKTFRGSLKEKKLIHEISS